MWSGFRAFLLKSNALALALAVIVGNALGAVVNSMVKDVIMPPLGLLLGRVDFSSLYIDLSGQSHASLKAAQDAGAATINYGLFLNSVVSFVVVAFVVFLMARALIREPAPTKSCPRCTVAVPAAATRCPNCTSEGI